MSTPFSNGADPHRGKDPAHGCRQSRRLTMRHWITSFRLRPIFGWLQIAPVLLLFGFRLFDGRPSPSSGGAAGTQNPRPPSYLQYGTDSLYAKGNSTLNRGVASARL